MELDKFKNKLPPAKACGIPRAAAKVAMARRRQAEKFVFRSHPRDKSRGILAQNKKILILGLGREGIDSFLFFRKLFPNKILGLADRKKLKDQNAKAKNLIKKDKKVKLYFGKNYLEAIGNYDIVIKSPGIPIHLPEIEKAFEEKKITSQTEIFLENCQGTIIGVTGTKGKSTTASLIYKILKVGGAKAYLVGNIGKPVLSLLFKAKPSDIYVCEMSSHQLYNLKKSPQVSIFLNVFHEHLDYYKNFKEYARAKANIALHQKKSDYLIFNSKDKIVKEVAKKSKAKKIPINTKHIGKFIKIKDIPLRGKFNLQNIAAAVEVAEIFEIQPDKIKKALRDFKPLKHRLELAGTFKGITFYNDSLSTIPETAIAAIDALGGDVQTIMLGGFDRKIDFKKLALKITKSDIRNVILFPTTGDKIWKSILNIKKRNNLRPFFTDNMKDAVESAYKNTKKGKICLLSCASTSFSLFRDYKEKGNLFKKWVRELSKR